MCGFLVTPSSFNKEESRVLFDKYISYRGTIPVSEKDWYGYNYKFARLPIVDISTYKNQPFIYKNFILVFNGELYNHVEIRKNLQDKYKIEFNTNSDCEVFLKAFITLGPKEFFKKACGMWAYVISDDKGNIFWGRDEYGIKPLFLKKYSSDYFFSSSQRALIKCIQKDGISYTYLKNFVLSGYQNPNAFSFYNNFDLVQPGYSYSFSKNKNVQEKQFCPFSDNSLIEKSLREVVNQVFISQYPKEVNSSIALSGGIDSTAILHILRSNNLSLNAFSLDLYASNQEKTLIEKTVKKYNLNHEFIKVDISDFLNKCEDIILNLGQPLRSGQPIYQYFLRERAAIHKSKVFFTGDGSDEIFGGYSQGFYFMLKGLIREGKSQEYIKSKLREFSALLFIDNLDFDNNNIFKLLEMKSSILKIDKEWESLFDFRDKLIQNPPNDLDEYCDFRLYDHPLPYWLITEDVVSLLNGLETRLPFLDQRLVYKSNFLDKNKFYFEGLNKYHLRSSLNDLPEHVINNKVKYPRPADTSLLIFNNEISKIIVNFIKSSLFYELFNRDNNKILELYLYDKNNNITKRSDNWFRLLSTYFFLKI